MEKQFISYPQKRMVEDRLREILQPVDGVKKTWAYPAGMNERLFTESLKAEIPMLTVFHVRGIRGDMFGHLRGPIEQSSPGQSKGAQIEALKGIVSRLERRVMALENHVRALRQGTLPLDE